MLSLVVYKSAQLLGFERLNINPESKANSSVKKLSSNKALI
jgi:hypothetical protein